MLCLFIIKVTPKTLDITAYDNENQVLDHVVLSQEEREEFISSGLVREEQIADR
jgi:hypothetical protein